MNAKRRESSAGRLGQHREHRADRYGRNRERDLARYREYRAHHPEMNVLENPPGDLQAIRRPRGTWDIPSHCNQGDIPC